MVKLLFIGALESPASIFKGKDPALLDVSRDLSISMVNESSLFWDTLKKLFWIRSLVNERVILSFSLSFALEEVNLNTGSLGESSSIISSSVGNPSIVGG